MFPFASRRRQILHDGFERRFWQVCCGRYLRAPEVEVIRQIQFVLLLQVDNLVDCGPGFGEVPIADGLLPLQQVGVHHDLRLQLGGGPREGPQQN